MTRDEFIAEALTLSRDELKSIANEQRERSAGRIPPEVQQKFRSLDDVTYSKEIYVDTEYGRTHVFLIGKNDTSDEKKPVIINVHGGGWCLPHTERDIYFCRRIANSIDAIVIDIDYVMAPEYPYPAAIEEIEALMSKIPSKLEEWGGDTNRVILCGQSAGGNLIGAVSQRNKCFDGIKVLKQILCYFPADNYINRFGTAELDERSRSTEYYGFFYNPVFEDRKKSDVSLVYASEAELSHLPETDIITGGLDDLTPDAHRYFDMLKEFGVSASYKCFENSRHGFMVNLYDEWKEAEEYLVCLIKKGLK